MAKDLNSEFDNEVDLNNEFDKEQDLSTSFDSEAQAAPVETPESSRAGEARLAGFTQDTALGFMDELKGGLEAGGQAIGIKGLGQEFGKQELQAPIGLSPEKLLEVYRQGRDLERQRLGELEKLPEYTQGSIAGMIIPAVSTGGAAVAGKQGLKELIKSGAKLGGTAALGASEADLTEGDIGEAAEDTAKGAVIGGAIAGVAKPAMEAGGAALKYVGGKIKDGAKLVARLASGLKQDDIDEIILRADAIKNAPGYDTLKKELVDKVEKIKDQTSKISEDSSKLLSDEKYIPKQQLMDELQAKINSYTDTAREPVVGELKSVLSYLKNKVDGDLMSQKDLHSLRKDVGLRAYAGTSKDAAGIVKTELRQLYTDFSNRLKQEAPEEFGRVDNEISKRLNVLEEAENKLGFKGSYGKMAVENEDLLSRKLQEVGSKTGSLEKENVEKLIKEIEMIAGKPQNQITLEDQLKAQRLKDILDKSGSEFNFAIRSGVGSLIGGLLGGPVGAAAGVSAGLAARPVSRALIQKAGALKGVGEKAAKLVDKSVEVAEPFATRGAILTQAKQPQTPEQYQQRLNDPDYVQNLLNQSNADVMENRTPAKVQFNEILKQYNDAKEQDRKEQIRYNMLQQPAYRKLIKKYE